MAGIKSQAQTTLSIYKVTYGLSLDDTDKPMAALVEAMTLLHKDSTYIKAYVSTEKIRVEEYGGLSPFVQISDLTDSVSYKLFDDKNASSSMKKVALRVPLATPKISVDVFAEDPAIFTSEEMELVLSDETEVIKNYTCHLARFILNESAEIHVWYVKDLPQLFWDEYDYLQKVPGLPLKIVSNSSDSKFDVGIVATSIEKIQVDTSLFEVPPDYTIQSF